MTSRKEEFVSELARKVSPYEAKRVEAAVEEIGDKEGLGKDARKELYSIVNLHTSYKRQLIKDFLNAVPTISDINVMVRVPANIEKRYSILPPDCIITTNFLARFMGVGNKRVVRRNLILQTEHYATIKAQRDYFGGKSYFSGNCQLIIEDTTAKKLKNSEKINSVCFFSKNFFNTRSAIAVMPQDKHQISRDDIPGLKRDFEAVQCELGFDYRLMMFVLGAICSQYLSRGIVEVKHNSPTSITTNTGSHRLVGPGEVIFTPGCGIDDIELNTFCMVAGLSGCSTVLLLCDRIVSTSSILGGYSLYSYICRLFRNIMYTSNSYGCGTEHLWAFMAGLHKVLKVYSHTDEGGAIRNILSEPVYPQTCGMLKQAQSDVLGYQQDIYGKGLLEKRALLDMLLFFPNALSYSDTGNKDYEEYIPTTLVRPKEDKMTLLSYSFFSQTFDTILNNMTFLMRNTFNLTNTNISMFNIYIRNLNKRLVDHHLKNTVIMPFLWTDPAVNNIYDFGRLTHTADFSYYRDITIPFFPNKTEIIYDEAKRQPFLRRLEAIELILPRHVMRNYGYSYILNSIYNDDNGLSEMVIMDEESIATRSFMTNNYLFSVGDPVIGQNKWYTPNCSINNFMELLPLLERNKVKLCATKDRYYPHPDLMTNNDLNSIHSLSKLIAVTKVESKVSKTRILRQEFADLVSKMIEPALQPILEEKVTISMHTGKFGNTPVTFEDSNLKKVESNVIAINNPQKSKDKTQKAVSKNNAAIFNLENRRSDVPFGVACDEADDAFEDEELITNNQKTPVSEEVPKTTTASLKTVECEMQEDKNEKGEYETYYSAEAEGQHSGEDEVDNSNEVVNDDELIIEGDNLVLSRAPSGENMILTKEEEPPQLSEIYWVDDDIKNLEDEIVQAMNSQQFIKEYIDMTVRCFSDENMVFLKNIPKLPTWGGFKTKVSAIIRKKQMKTFDKLTSFAKIGGTSKDPDFKIQNCVTIAPGVDEKGKTRLGVCIASIRIPKKGNPSVKMSILPRPDWELYFGSSGGERKNAQ